MRAESRHRLISCVLPKGLGHDLAGRLYREKGLTRVSVHSARGFLGSDPSGLFNRVEKEYLSVIVAPERADELFEWIYREAEVSEKEGRFLLMARAARATPFELPPDVPPER